MTNEFIVFVGPMFGGKTTKLLGAIDRYKYQGRQIKAFKPKIDARYSQENIVTHWGGHAAAISISKGSDIYRHLDATPNQVIAVDEAFMISGISVSLVDLFGRGHTILVSSLQICSDSTVYSEIKEMMPWATKIEICPAVCAECNNDAYYTKKIGGDKNHSIEVGGAEMYQPVCFKHFKDYLDNNF